MNSILFSDPHFTDVELERYRWNIFNFIRDTAIVFQEVNSSKIHRVICLGDLVDKKDRHSAKLVNDLVEYFADLKHEISCEIILLAGNHDKPLQGPYYWKFLNDLGISYIEKPLKLGDCYFLPFSNNPVEEWKDLDFSDTKVIYMHQTVDGALIENDRKIEGGHKLPELSPKIQIFSGDVHRPQTVNGIVYIGAPHPVRFSEDWENRIVVVKDEEYWNFQSIETATIKRAIIDITDSKALENTPYKEGDQIRIRYLLSGQALTTWPQEQERITAWAKENKVILASLESALIGDGLEPDDTEEAQRLEVLKPEEIVKKFGLDEKLSDDLIQVGVDLVKEI